MVFHKSMFLGKFKVIKTYSKKQHIETSTWKCYCNEDQCRQSQSCHDEHVEAPEWVQRSQQGHGGAAQGVHERKRGGGCSVHAGVCQFQDVHLSDGAICYMDTTGWFISSDPRFGWVKFGCLFHILSNSARAAGNQAELAGQPSNRAELSNLSQQDLRSDLTNHPVDESSLILPTMLMRGYPMNALATHRVAAFSPAE